MLTVAFLGDAMQIWDLKIDTRKPSPYASLTPFGAQASEWALKQGQVKWFYSNILKRP
jgi:hypothetical protein